MSELACILKSGAVVLDSHIACDGHYSKCDAGIITHVHEDHLKGFETMLGDLRFEAILVSPITWELLVAVRNDFLKYRTNLKAVGYGETYPLVSGQVTLYPSTHMLGAAQVLLETPSGTRIVYTGDIGIGTKAIRSDILIIDSCHGDPEYNFDHNNIKDAERHLVSTVVNSLQEERTIHIKAHRGTLQEVMDLLRRTGVKCGFVADERNFRVASVYENHGKAIKPIYMGGTPKARELERDREPHIRFCPMNARLDVADKVISVHSWGTRHPYSNSHDSTSVCIPNHADLNTVIDYVESSEPETVVTDNVRGQGIQLAEEIRTLLGIEAHPSPPV